MGYGRHKSCARHVSVYEVMARKKARVSWGGPGYGGPSEYVYFEEDEINIFRNDEQFRISLVEKYYPSYRGRVTNACVGGNIEDA